MNYSSEQCVFVIKNAAALESGIIETVQSTVFAAINAHLEKKLKALGGWKGVFALASDEADDTYFAPLAWPESQDGRYRACYKLSETSGDENDYWLSSALGVNNVKLCLRFWVHGGLGGRSKGEVERKLLTVANAAEVKAAGFIADADNTLCLPFVIDAATVAAEYPALNKSLAPLDAALDKLMKAHPQLDAAVQSLTAKK